MMRQSVCLGAAILAGLWLVTGVLAGCSTSKARGVSAFELADQEDDADLLDAPTDEGASGAEPAPKTTADQEPFVLPTPPADKKKTIDAEIDDWARDEARKFDSADHVVRGSQFWDGGVDASFRISLDADEGHVYFWVDVRDDHVIDAASEDVMADGVILWLRDPKLEDIVDGLPEAMNEKADVRPEMAILFTPDGQFWRFDEQGGQLYRAGIDAAAKKMKNGYRLEIALSVGVLEQVASLPVEDLAFRAEVMDGDETDRRGEQTRMSMLPDEHGPRFALYNVGGWLPYEQAEGQPPRPGALGRWVLDGGTWAFESFEVRPEHWLVLQDVSSFDAALADSEALSKLCPTATDERTLIEAYQSQSGRHRAGLVLCGPRSPQGRCPVDATSNLYWVHLRPDREGWQLAEHTEVTDKPLQQCAHEAHTGGELYDDFSLLPMEMLGSSVWGVGFKKSYASSAEEIEERGIWFVNPSAQEPYLGRALNERVYATRHERTVSKSHVYLALVDDQKGLDLCEVERVKEQSCRGLNQSCETLEHGEMVQSHIKMWVPGEGRFEPYLLTKHRRCNSHFDFSKRRGFMLINEAGRLGALASPAN